MSESVSAYVAAKAVNEVLKNKGILNKEGTGIKQLPPQMFYNYTTSRIKKGQKPLIECDSEGRILVSALKEWTKKYLQKMEDKKEENIPNLMDEEVLEEA